MIEDEECVLDENNAAGTRSPSTDLLYCLRWHENEVIELEKMIGEEVDNNFMVNNLKAKVERHKSFVAALKAVAI